MKAAVIAHDHLSDPGLLGDALMERGIELDVVTVVAAERFDAPDVRVDFPPIGRHDLIVTLGAPWSVYDKTRLGRWPADEAAYLRAADAAGVPVLGVCFGGQLLADAHGGTVVRADDAEIGWHTIITDDADLVAAGPWFEWHFDTWSLPPGAREIARTPAASQAFVLRRNLAVQFHPEVTPAVLHAWLDNGGLDAAVARGIDPDLLVRHTAKAQPAAAQRARALAAAFLDQVAFASR